LSGRILELEHRIYPEAIKLFSEGRIERDGRKIRIKGSITDLPPMVNPKLSG
jgi:phosphoribosylglycinamide formyltransferase 1